MNEQEFRQKLHDEGYGNPQIHVIEPGPEKEMHTHEYSVLSFVLKGEFTMINENGSQTCRAGDWCENPAGTLHTERIGPAGVTALVGTK